MEKSSLYKNPIFWIVILTIGTLTISLIIFNINHCCTGLPLLPSSTLGLIGDFYGGLIGTLVTFVGLYFIYQTYQVQQKQLDIAKKDADLEILNKLYSDLLQEINSIQYRRIIKKDGESKEELLFGIDALYNFDENHHNSSNSVLNHLNSIIFSFDQLIYMADEKVRYKYNDMKKIMLTKIYFLYYSKITWPVFHKIYDHRETLKLEDNPDFDSFMSNYIRLTKKTQEYLQKAGHIGKPITKGMIDLLRR